MQTCKSNSFFFMYAYVYTIYGIEYSVTARILSSLERKMIGLYIYLVAILDYLYYTVWALVLVRSQFHLGRVWPMLLLGLGSVIVGWLIYYWFSYKICIIYAHFFLFRVINVYLFLVIKFFTPYILLFFYHKYSTLLPSLLNISKSYSVLLYRENSHLLGQR